MVYYRIKEDINFPHRWYLGNILNDKDNWKFTYGNYLVPSCGYKVDVYRNGDAMDYTTTEVYCVPIISERTKKVFQKYQGVQFFDAEINNIEGMYSIFNITEVIDCVDEKNSDFEKFELNDPIRPDLAGQYSAFYKLIIDPSKTNGKPIFRVKYYDIGIIVNEVVKNDLTSHNIIGVLFEQVTV